MTPNDPRWAEFIERLEGPEGCNFTMVGDDFNTTRWDCDSRDYTKPFSRKILTAMGLSPIDIEDTLAYCDAHGGHCDCEILFNCGGDEARTMTDARVLTTPDEVVQHVITTLLEDFEHSLDQSEAGDWLPITDVEPHVLRSTEAVSKFLVRLEDGSAVEVTGRYVPKL